jgi:hypothetical protein
MGGLAQVGVWERKEVSEPYFLREVVTSNDKPRIVAHGYIIEASIDESLRHAQAVA